MKVIPSLIVFFIAVLMQTLYLNSAPVIAHYDSVGYLRAALKIIDTGSLLSVPSFRTPGYHLFLVGLFTLFGNSGFVIVVAQHLLIALLSGLVTFLCSTQMKLRYAIFVGVLIALDPILALYGSWVIAEIPFSVALTIGVIYALRTPSSKRAAALSGFCFGVATLFRPSGLVAFMTVLFLLLLSIATKRISFRFGRDQFLLMSTLYLLVLAPWFFFRYYHYKTFRLVETDSSFLTIQMLQNQKLFDPQLIEPHSLQILYQEIIEGKTTSEEERINNDRSVAWAFHNALISQLGSEKTDAFYAHYLEHFKNVHAKKYYSLMGLTVLELLHLRNDYPATPLTANRYLGEVIPYKQQLESITKTPVEFEILYHPGKYKNVAHVWQKILHYIHFTKPIVSLLLVFAVGYLFISVARNPLLTPFLLLPYLILLLQACAYSFLLHNEDRYTYVLNPLIYLQLGLILQNISTYPWRGDKK